MTICPADGLGMMALFVGNAAAAAVGDTSYHQYFGLSFFTFLFTVENVEVDAHIILKFRFIDSLKTVVFFQANFHFKMLRV